MSLMLRRCSLITAILSSSILSAQCPGGELPVEIRITTDAYGNETYWELVPTGNGCGAGTIASGGNSTVGCTMAGSGLSPNGGYANNTTITSGPHCLTENDTYDLIAVDSYGDDQAAFEVLIDGASLGTWQEPGGMQVYTFTVAAPAERDLGVSASTTSLFTEVGLPTTVTGTVRNFGSETVTSFSLAYRLDNGAVETMDVTGVSIASGGSHDFAYATPWDPQQAGAVQLRIWPTLVNGQPDQSNVNDTLTRDLMVNEPVPNLIDDLLAAPPVLTEVANSDEDLLVPRDLDFHPDRSRDELWVINKDTENSGGSTVRFTHPGATGQEHLWQRDYNAWHFMSLPTAIAMADNNNFATSPGVYDANHDGGLPFTGPTLWSSDPAIYAQNLFGPLGSHLDMVHVHPRSQGIAHDQWNTFWVVDGTNGDIVMTDFRGDHGPGNDYHGNAIIHRYREFTIERDPNDHIVSHCVLDKRTGQLYVVDNGGQRVLRLDTRTGTVGANATVPQALENYVEYKMVTGYDWEVLVSTGLDKPAGIDVVGDRLLVSDHANGDIIAYDISGEGAPEIGRIHTGPAGIMGIKVGPDGSLWYVNATTHQLMRAQPVVTGIEEARQAPIVSCYPNPVSALLFLKNDGSLPARMPAELLDATGRVALRATIAQLRAGLDVSALAPGQYAMRIPGLPGQRIVVAR